MVRRLRWVRPVQDLLKGIGFGYSAASANLGRAVEAGGVELADDAPIAVHFDYPLSFEPIPGVRNVLFTMYEAHPLPAAFVPAIRRADAVIVPSRFCYDLFRPHLRGIPLATCPLGFDPKVFYPPEKPREWVGTSAWRIGDERLRFLWSGSPSARKGWDRLTQSWSFVMGHEPWCELLFKTTDENAPGTEGMTYRVSHNVSLTTKTFTWQELGDMYRRAHVFVAPSHGEGWGLTPLEAMATGLPTIVTKFGGVLDFCTERTAIFTTHEFDTVETPLGPARFAFAKLGGLARTMLETAQHYDRMVERGLRAAEYVHRRFVWNICAERFIEVIDRLWSKGAA